MLRLSLTSAEYRALMATLVVSHRKQIDVEIKDRNEDTISTLSALANRVIGGAVQVDSGADITRTLESLTIVDPKRKLRFEADTPAHGAVYADRFVSVAYRVYVPSTVTTFEGETITGIGDWVPIPVFWGPVGHYAREGVEVSIDARGKEVLGLDPALVHEGYTLHKGAKITESIKDVARRQGETRFDIPELNARLKKPRVVERGAEWWKVIAGEKRVPHLKKKDFYLDRPIPFPLFTLEPTPGLVAGIPGHYGAFRNARGQLAVRRLTRHSTYTFRYGRDLTTRPSLDYDSDAIRNFVRVLGKKQGHRRAEGHAALDPSHPLSPQAMSWNGKPRYLEHTVNAEHLKSDAECRSHAKEILKRVSQQALDISFECFPIPMLEEDDWIEVETPEYRIPVQAKQFTIPLSSDSNMSIGRHKKVRIKKRRRTHRGGGRAGPPGGRGGGGRHRHHRHHHGGRN